VRHQAAARLAVELTALAAAETQSIIALLQRPLVEPSVPFQDVEQLAVVRLAAELTAMAAVEAQILIVHQ